MSPNRSRSGRSNDPAAQKPPASLKGVLVSGIPVYWNIEK